jgi:beta-lactamase superfamily II metal-dependent hydrolase
MDSLRVRAYNVRFGDAILVTIPDRAGNGTVTKRHILIDVGNVLMGAGGQDEVFDPVVHDILRELDRRPLDLYVMTHEHMDHIQGLLWAWKERDLKLRATHAWLTASAARDYYDRFPDAKKKKLEFQEAYERIALHLAATTAALPAGIESLRLNNDPRTTADCVEHLRTVGDQTSFVSRAADVTGTHPFSEARFEIWGPEEDTSVYYGAFKPMGLPIGPTVAGSVGTGAPVATSPDPVPPPGVDAGAFYNLVERRRRGIFDNLLAIDKAANNSSVVFLVEWRGWRLLFPGDAEERAWKEMAKRNQLAPVHFLKIGHHGSHNGTPDGDLLDAILPPVSPDGRPRSALVSTHEGTYNNVPDPDTLARVGERSTLFRIGEAGDTVFIDLTFPDPG